MEFSVYATSNTATRPLAISSDWDAMKDWISKNCNTKKRYENWLVCELDEDDYSMVYVSALYNENVYKNKEYNWIKEGF